MSFRLRIRQNQQNLDRHQLQGLQFLPPKPRIGRVRQHGYIPPRPKLAFRQDAFSVRHFKVRTGRSDASEIVTHTSIHRCGIFRIARLRSSANDRDVESAGRTCAARRQ